MLRAAPVVASVLLVAPFARAAEPREVATLAYERKAGAEACVDAAELRNQVAGHLGYQPFVDDAQLAATVVIAKRGAVLVAEIELREKPAKLVGRRSLRSTAADCRELGASLALALSIAIDPLSANRPPESAPKPVPTPVPPPAPIPASPPAVAAVPPPLQAPPDRPLSPGPRPIPRVAAGGLASFETAPSPAAGAWLYGGARLGRLSLGVEGRADLPVSKDAEPRGTFATSLLLGSLIPCVHHAFARACVPLSFGALQSRGDGVTDSRAQATFFSSAGLRLGADLGLTRGLGLTAFAGVSATLTPTTLELDGREVWRTPLVTGLFGLGAAFDFGSDDGNGRGVAIR